MLNNFRKELKKTIQMVSNFFDRFNLHPNYWTGISLIFAILSGVFYSKYIIITDDFINLPFSVVLHMNEIIAVSMLLISGLFDMVDGELARKNNLTTKFGEFLDSTSDRFAEIFIYLGILVGGYTHSELVYMVITLSLMISYIRSKSETIQIKMVGIGIAERAERLLLLAIGTIVGQIQFALIVILILSVITIIQRIVFIKKNSK
jgi:archaetidylinositol phosphate synthase